MVAHTTTHRRLAGMKTFLLLAGSTFSIRLLKFLSLWIFAFLKRHFKIVMKFNIPLPGKKRRRRTFAIQLSGIIILNITWEPTSSNILILKTGLSEVKDGVRCDVSIGVGMFSQHPSPAYRDHRRLVLQISALNEPSRSFHNARRRPLLGSSLCWNHLSMLSHKNLLRHYAKW